VGSPNVVRFQEFALDAGRRIVSRGGRRVHLTRKAFDLLTILVEEAPRVVSKEELHQRLWPNTFVTDATVAGVVKELRRVLGGEEGREPLVRTVHGVGYAFTGTIQTGDRDDAANPRYWLVSGTRRLILGDGANEIGRDPRAAVWLDSAQASRRHARIVIADETATLEDLGSKNRTLVNDRPVIEPTRLSDGDAIQIGSAIFVFRVMDTLATTETAGATEAS
jgi:DNA-binding winged helix-turn-helix (wHTH) protein